ncbi:MAG TPA: hypothetical protein K8V56_06895 [Sporosarcina psychrophila]|uniref:Uncharacterized protein n=1 Tax=Sporosarcina psychrophila TaxID=1476 RepID=A0A921FXF2_SPOPS|nr:hypothetical protein [Sporosarcina psychrophila]
MIGRAALGNPWQRENLQYD